MQARKSFRPAAFAVAIGLAGALPSAQALNIVFQDVGATAMTSQQFAAFETAASYWESKLTDNVTVFISIGFDNLGGSTLGSATSSLYQMSYSTLRTRLTADATSATDASAVSHLQAGSALSFIATQPSGAEQLDNNNTANNRFLWLTAANAKALGVTDTPTNGAGSPDATIRFSTGFASNFAYTRVNGHVPADKIDFITVAEHEIGHALGFVSGVDSIDQCIHSPAQCGSPSTFDNDVTYSPLDLFRYSSAGTLNLAVDNATSFQPYFSVDGGATSILRFSTGTHNGDGNQASHFTNSALTLMKPIVSFGASYDATPADLTAMDAIGWNLAAVPEPETYALMLGGLGVLAWARRRSNDSPRPGGPALARS